ncbi:MAG: protein kinase [Anaerolineales bacterium]|nr:protein kinase [Anaerolineales bacterium]
MILEIGSLFNNRYRLEAELGHGGMGVVYRAQDTILERSVAVKLLSNSQIGTEGRARMLREAQAAARLNHPNIVSIYDAGEIDGNSFIIMELLEGESLYDLRPETLDQTLDIIRQICKALEHAHAHGIVHRDLKPENVIVSSTGVAKLTDFGLARSITSRLSAEGAFIGTIHYMAPEQAMGEDVDGRADLYALGGILYELTTGRLPFTGDDPLAIISQHLHAPVIPPRTYNPGIPPALDQLIVSLLSKRKEERPPNAALVRAALEPNALAVESTALKPSGINILVRGRLIGREQELAEAKSLWRQMTNGIVTQPVILISGEPGVGKSPLVREIKALAEVTAGIVLVDECYAEGNAPYAPLNRIIQDVIEKTQVQLSDLVLADLASISPGLRIRYTQLPQNQPVDAAVGQHRLFESVYTLLATATQHAPILLILEDVHWADSGTLYLIRHLARRARNASLRLLIVLTYRETELEDVSYLTEVLLDFHREHLAARLKLGRYDRAQTRRVLSIMFQEEVAPEFAEAIFKETDGNLFFIEEVCRALIEQGKLTYQDGHWEWPSLKELELPQSVRLAIQARIAKLTPEAQDVLRLAAVIGREFDFETLHAACELSEDQLVEALENAEQGQLISEVHADYGKNGRKNQERFAFAHGLITTTLRETISGLRRHRLHRRVAAAIETLRPDDYPALAYHYEQAKDLENATNYYAKAGERALSIYANQEADRYFRAALDLVDTGVERAALLAGLGEALFRQSLYQKAVAIWKEASNLYIQAQDYDAMCRIYARTARSIWYAGDVQGGLNHCLEGLEAAPKSLESPGMAALLHETARAHFFNQHPDEAGVLCQQALEMAEKLGLIEVQADTLSTLGLLPNQTFDTKRAYLAKAVELAENAGLYTTAVRAHINLGGRLQEVDELSAARSQFLRAYELSQKMGILSWAHDNLGTATFISLSMGDFTTAEASLNEIDTLSKSTIIPEKSRHYHDTIIVTLKLMRGEWSLGIELLDQMQAQAAQEDDQHLLSQIMTWKGQAYLEMKDYHSALSWLEKATSLADQHNLDDKFSPRMLACLTLLAQGEVQAARSKYAETQSIPQFETIQELWLDKKWCESALAVAEGRWEEAIAGYQEMETHLTRAGRRWHLARVLLDWGEAFARHAAQGDAQKARSLYQQAIEIFTQLDANGYVQMALDLLDELEKQPTV